MLKYQLSAGQVLAVAPGCSSQTLWLGDSYFPYYSWLGRLGCLFVCLYTLFEFANPNEHKCSMTRQRICYFVTGKEGWGENKEKKREW